MSDEQLDMLLPEQAIVERLIERVPGLKSAQRIRDIDQSRTTGAATPAALVAYDGMNPAAAPQSDSAVQVVQLRWMVVLVVRNARGQESGTGVRDEASQILYTMIRALLGFSPGPGFYPLALVQGGGQVVESGFGYFWQPFQTTTAIEGQD